MRKRHILLYGFSIFSMFFGSGNLVFPLMVGVHNAENWFAGFIGFFLTGIVLPFLGLFVIKLHRGSCDKFFAEAGNIARIIVPFFTLSLLGSFGVIPRCITVAHGGLEFLYKDFSLLLFSVIFCISCFIICINDKWMFTILGKFLTPILLLFLIILISVGYISAPYLEQIDGYFQKNAIDGFFRGYATMDLFAAFFFSSLIFKQIEELVDETEGKSILRVAMGPSIFGASLLGFIYLGFVYLGAHYRFLATDLPGELILPAIANYLLGKNGALFIAVIIIFSCLTTAVALNSIYARYLCSAPMIGQQKFPQMLLLTTAISFTISLLDFDGIAAILGPMLTVSYPALIALTIMSIATKHLKPLKMLVFYGIVLYMIVV